MWSRTTAFARVLGDRAAHVRLGLVGAVEPEQRPAQAVEVGAVFGVEAHRLLDQRRAPPPRARRGRRSCSRGSSAPARTRAARRAPRGTSPPRRRAASAAPAPRPSWKSVRRSLGSTSARVLEHGLRVGACAARAGRSPRRPPGRPRRPATSCAAPPRWSRPAEAAPARAGRSPPGSRGRDRPGTSCGRARLGERAREVLRLHQRVHVLREQARLDLAADRARLARRRRRRRAWRPSWP